MTIKEYIIKGTITSIEERKCKLTEIGAPSVLISAMITELDKLRSGNLTCRGEVELLEHEMENVEQKKGRGGIPYYVFNGNINYFPKAKYGRFIAKGEVK